MGTKKNGHFGKIFGAPGGSYTRREREFAAQAPLSGPPPACRSVPPAAPSSHTPLGKSTPRLIKSSKTHFRAHFLQKLSHNLLVHTTNIASRHRTRTFSWFACSSTRQAARTHAHSNPKEPADIAQHKICVSYCTFKYAR